MSKRKLSISTLFFISCLQLMGNNPSSYITNNIVQEIDNFDYDVYIETLPITSIKKLEIDRVFIFENGKNGDEFVKNAFEAYIQKQDFSNFDEVKQYLCLSELLIHSKTFLPDSIVIYSQVGNRLLDALSSDISTQLEQEAMNPNQFEYRYVDEILDEYQFSPAAPINNWVKIFRYFEEGRYEYIWNKAITTYLSKFIMFLFISLILIVSYLWFAFSFFRRLH